MKEQIDFLANAIKQTKEFIKTLPDVEDKGSCNLDTVMINFDGWKQKDVTKLSQLIGLSIGEKMSGWNKGNRFIFFLTKGQTYANTFIVESAKKKLNELGVESASVWYKMD